MQQALRDYANNTGATGLQMRVALHAGEVVVLTVGKGIRRSTTPPALRCPLRPESSKSPSRAQTYAHRQLELARTLGARAWALARLTGKALVLKGRGRLPEARQLSLEAVEQTRELEPPLVVPDLLRAYDFHAHLGE